MPRHAAPEDLLLKDELRYGIVKATTLEALTAEVNRHLAYGAQVCGGLLRMPESGLCLQPMLFPVPAGTLRTDATRCSREDCRVRERCLRYVEREEPWMSELFWVDYFGGVSCDGYLVAPKKPAALDTFEARAEACLRRL